jgi:NADPH-dependent curcumin reductase CurA
MRLRLRESGPAGYFNSFPLHAAMDEILTVGEVVESRAEGYAPGDTVSHAFGWRDYSLVKDGVPSLGGVGTLARLDTTLAPAEKFLGPVGNMGLTAYVGLVDGAQLREGDVVWVSAAAGAVGSLAAQIAKLRGHYVIGSAGSPAKVRHLLDELGLDAAFDYHDGPVLELLREAAPDGIDVYFDNVGGDHLEAAIGSLRLGGRIAICGAISVYNNTEAAPGPRNLARLIQTRGRIQGFLVGDHYDLAGEYARQAAGWIADGSLTSRETFVEGIDHAVDGFLGVLRGDNVGKMLVRL